MAKVDWRSLALEPGVYREPTPDVTRVSLWLAGEAENGFQRWERITNVPGAASAEEQGLCFTQADSMPARQKVRGVFGRLFESLRKPDGNAAWLLPTGGYAEQIGERRTGLLLVWPADETAVLDEAGLRLRWPESARVRKVAANLFVVYPAEPGSETAAATVPAHIDEARAQAEEALAAARHAGDSAKEAAALTDLGVALTRAGAGQHAVGVLQEALALSRRQRAPSLESDALANLGLAHLAIGQADQAQSLLGQALGLARTAGERHVEKLALANLALVLATMHEFKEALGAAGHALVLARELGDRAGEADLLWFQAVQNAEAGHADEAAALAQSAIDLHAAMRSPHVRWLSTQLKKYRPLASGPRHAPGAVPASYYTGPTTAAAPEPAPDPAALRNAMSAVKALEASAGSGLKAVASGPLELRLQTCKGCLHHTGLRCRLCGQFTQTKARLPYETCPAAKWSG